MPVYASRPEPDPVAICRERAMEAADSAGYDTVILDTAGRLHIDDALMAELRPIKADGRPAARSCWWPTP